MNRQSVSQPQRVLSGAALALAVLLGACNKNGGGDDYDLAKESMTKAETPTAIIHLKAALQKEPNRWEARALLGYALMRSGDPIGAAVELEKAHAAQFNPDEVVPALATAILQSGKPQAVVDRFSQLKMQTPAATAALQASLGIAYWQIGNKIEAEAAVARALEAAPVQSNALMLKANIAASKGDIDGAIELMNWLLQRNPKDMQAMLLLSQLQRTGKRDPVAAEQTLLKAVGIEPRFIDAQKALLLYRLELKDVQGAKNRLAEIRKAAPKHSTTLYLTALTAYADGDMKAAREALQPLLKYSSNIGYLQLLAGMIEFKSNSLLKAETHLTKGLQLLPEEVQPRLALADLYLRRDQADKSLAALGPLLDRKPLNSEVLGAVADVYMHIGDTAKAEAAYAAAAKLAPENNRAQVALASARLARGGGDDGLRELETLSRLSKPDDVYAEMALFNVKLRKGDLDGAMLAVDAMLKKQPTQATPWILKAGIFERKNDADGAKSALEKAIQLDPTNFRAASRLADYDAHVGKFDAAVNRLSAITKADPQHTGAKLTIADIKRRGGATSEALIPMLELIVRDDPSSSIARARLIDELLRQNQIGKALEAAQSAVTALPDNPRVLNALGDAQYRTGNLEQAIGTFKKLSNLNPKDPHAPFRLAEVQLSAGQRHAAIASLKQSLELRPDYLPSQRALAAILLRAGEQPEALKIARAVQTQRPKEDLGYLLEGDLEASRKNWAAATKAYRAALDRRPSGEAMAKLHQLIVAAGDTVAANQLANSWRKAHPEDVQFMSYLSEQAIAAGRYAEAEALLRDIVKASPSRSNAWGSLAFALIQQKNRGAADAASKAVQLAPDNPGHWQMLAQAQAADGNLAEALKSQREAVRLSGAKPDYSLGLAKLLIQAGNKAEAKKELQGIANIKGQFTGRAEAVKLLMEL